MPDVNQLVDSPAEIVQQVIIDLGLGTDPTPWASGVGDPWPVFAEGEGDHPDDCITVYTTQGVDHGQSMVDLQLFQHYGIQVRVRSANHPTGWQKAKDLRVSLSRFGQQEVSGGLLNAGSIYLVWAIAKMGQVLPIGREIPNSKRRIFTINAQLAVDVIA